MVLLLRVMVRRRKRTWGRGGGRRGGNGHVQGRNLGGSHCARAGRADNLHLVRWLTSCKIQIDDYQSAVCQQMLCCQ